MLRVSQHSASSSPDWLGPAATAASPLASRWAAPGRMHSRPRFLRRDLLDPHLVAGLPCRRQRFGLSLVVHHGPPMRLIENARLRPVCASTFCYFLRSYGCVPLILAVAYISSPAGAAPTRPAGQAQPPSCRSQLATRPLGRPARVVSHRIVGMIQTAKMQAPRHSLKSPDTSRTSFPMHRLAIRADLSISAWTSSFVELRHGGH
ncbi:hypothetical protein HNQ71_000100 [Mesorhizobium sangaii]|uniref:Uncharacterized protein n=1 Tax=Mesorhizobium sangaii TaxID=505389 RepID=A0A841NWV6_9HYPH|nr:hypothetical protein [Mesorhizobium sangaii]